jgi:uncharacterized protein (TIGR03437 family)
VTVDGTPATVRYAGFSQKTFSGVYEIRLRIPDSIQSGRAALLVSAGQQQSIELKIAVE